MTDRRFYDRRREGPLCQMVEPSDRRRAPLSDGQPPSNFLGKLVTSRKTPVVCRSPRCFGGAKRYVCTPKFLDGDATAPPSSAALAGQGCSQPDATDTNAPARLRGAPRGLVVVLCGVAVANFLITIHMRDILQPTEPFRSVRGPDQDSIPSRRFLE